MRSPAAYRVRERALKIFGALVLGSWLAPLGMFLGLEFSMIGVMGIAIWLPGGEWVPAMGIFVYLGLLFISYAIGRLCGTFAPIRWWISFLMPLIAPISPLMLITLFMHSIEGMSAPLNYVVRPYVFACLAAGLGGYHGSKAFWTKLEAASPALPDEPLGER